MRKNEPITIFTAANGFIVMPMDTEYVKKNKDDSLVFDIKTDLINYLSDHFDESRLAHDILKR